MNETGQSQIKVKRFTSIGTTPIGLNDHSRLTIGRLKLTCGLIIGWLALRLRTFHYAGGHVTRMRSGHRPNAYCTC